MQAKSIPELLGFAPIPLSRERPYSAASYRAMYRLSEEEAEDVIRTYHTHPQINRALAHRFISDGPYRERITTMMREDDGGHST
jgi:hypothetical protein